MSSHGVEVSAGERFEFGANWARFLGVLNEDRIALAEQSLRTALGVSDLKEKSFLDVGSGSGLLSLAARRLGARVHSFDYDPRSVACISELKRRFFACDPDWRVEAGSALERDYLSSLGQFDIVYSWGVLHHTGAMWQALDNVLIPLAHDGVLYISIYRDQGSSSGRWLRIKRTYNRIPQSLRLLFALPIIAAYEFRAFVHALLRLNLSSYLRRWTDYAQSSMRGMSKWHDWIDWIGGYPFEVAKPEQIFDFYRKRGLELIKLRTAGGWGCNEYVFLNRTTPPSTKDGISG